MFVKETPCPQAEAWGKQLLLALTAKKMWKQSKLREGIQALTMLRKKHNDDVITKAVDWYCLNAGEEYVPKIVTALSFANRFADVLSAMSRQPDLSDESSISSRAKAIVQSWIINRWPVEIECALPGIVQQSMDNWRKTTDFLRSNDIHQTDVFFAIHILRLARDFVDTVWVPLLYSKYGWMDAYKGSISSLIYRPKSILFRDHVWWRWSRDYCGKARHYDSLLRELQDK